MVAKTKLIEEYFDLIKKLTNRKIANPEHHQLKADVSQEVFLKLFKQDYFNNNNLGDEKQEKLIAGYISTTVMSCYYDHLQALGLTRRSTKSEREQSNKVYENINTSDIEDVCESNNVLHLSDTSEQYQFVKEAYQWILNCFESAIEYVNDTSRRNFIETAFWQFDQYDMTMKMLAGHLGYQSSNPTQEFKRFAQKVSLCTEPHGVSLQSPQEQIQFLREQMISLGAVE
jgi:DNA-directed RNA polymerase specialized sigma24 family protein